jgi:hypothetical protein
MIYLQVTSRGAVVSIFERWTREVRRGASEGVKRSVDLMGEDLAEHTPIRTGKALGAITTRMQSALTGTAGYNLSEAFYMRFVLMGSKAHEIHPRRRAGNRGRAAQAKRNLHAALRRVGVDADRMAQLGRGLGVQHLALSLSVGGNLLARARVWHPGTKAQPILADRLAAMTPTINETIGASIRLAVAEGKG